MRFTSVCTIGQHRAHDHREGGEREHDGLPVDAVGAEGEVEDPEQAGEPGDLHARTPSRPRSGWATPWYTSGVQKWNGTAATLNAKPDEQQGQPGQQQAVVGEDGRGEEASEISTRLVEPVAP